MRRVFFIEVTPRYPAQGFLAVAKGDRRADHLMHRHAPTVGPIAVVKVGQQPVEIVQRVPPIARRGAANHALMLQGPYRDLEGTDRHVDIADRPAVTDDRAQGSHVAVYCLRLARLQNVVLRTISLRVCRWSLNAIQQILPQAEEVVIVGVVYRQLAELEALEIGEICRLGLAEAFRRRVTIVADHVRPRRAMLRGDGAIERPFF